MLEEGWQRICRKQLVFILRNDCVGGQDSMRLSGTVREAGDI